MNGTNLASKFNDNINPVSILSDRVQNNFEFTYVNNNDIIEATIELNEVSGGYDGVPTKIVKKVIDYIVCPLSHVINKSLTSGTFPANLKIAKIIPIFKDGDKQSTLNYRPVSMLSTFSKIFEKIIFKKFNEFVNENNIICDSQHGFTSGKSTVTALLHFTEELHKVFDRKHYAVGLFIDLSKAFETINHQILLEKLEHYGVRGVSLSFFRSYLKDRKQFVQLGNIKSNLKQINLGVPQGSILAPLLFLLYINDMPNVFDSMKPVLFADDSCFYESGANLNAIIDNINKQLVDFSDWIYSNKLTINYKRSHYVVFHRKKILPDNKFFIKLGKLFQIMGQ